MKPENGGGEYVERCPGERGGREWPEPGFFPAPPGIQWKDISIRFVDGHTVAVNAAEVTGVYHYAERDIQWKLFRAFKNNQRVMTWQSSDAHPRNQKRKEILSRKLRAFFRLEGEPIPWDKEEDGWRCRFEFVEEYYG